MKTLTATHPGEHLTPPDFFKKAAVEAGRLIKMMLPLIPNLLKAAGPVLQRGLSKAALHKLLNKTSPTTRCAVDYGQLLAAIAAIHASESGGSSRLQENQFKRAVLFHDIAAAAGEAFSARVYSLVSELENNPYAAPALECAKLMNHYSSTVVPSEGVGNSSTAHQLSDKPDTYRYADSPGTNITKIYSQLSFTL